MERFDITLSDAEIGKRVHRQGNSVFYVLNEISGLRSLHGSHFSRYEIAMDDAGRLARRLQHTEPATFGLLHCKGFTLSGQRETRKLPWYSISRQISRQIQEDYVIYCSIRGPRNLFLSDLKLLKD